MDARLQPVAVAEPVLISVAKAVAGRPTWTERLEGNTAATRDWGLLVEGIMTHTQTTVLSKHWNKDFPNTLSLCRMVNRTRIQAYMHVLLALWRCQARLWCTAGTRSKNMLQLDQDLSNVN